MKTDAQTLAERLNKLTYCRDRQEAFQAAEDVSTRTFFHLYSERVYQCRDGSGFIFRSSLRGDCIAIENWTETYELVMSSELPSHLTPGRDPGRSA